MSEPLPPAPASVPDPAEVERLRAENERLQADLLRAKGVSRHRLRRATAAVLAFLTALLLVLGVVGGWTSRTAFDTDKFVARVGPIIDQPQVRAAISTQIGDQLVSTLDLQDRLRPVLPDNLQFLAGPIASGAEDVVRKQVVKVVDGERFRTVWFAALRLSQEQVVRLLSGSNENVQVTGGKIVVDLIGVVNLVLQNIQSQLPGVLGSTSLQIPDNLPVDQIRALVAKYLNISLPEDFAQVPVMDAGSLESARTGYTIVNTSVVLVLVLTLVAFVLALVASVDRRRTLLQFGLWLAGITAVVFFVTRGLSNATLDSIRDPVLRPAVNAGVHEIFSSLRGFAALLFWIGLVLAAVMYLVGPGRFPAWVRGTAARGARWTTAKGREVAAHEGLAGWVAHNLDAVRVGGAVVAAVLLLFLASWTALIVIGVLLVLYEVGVTLWARSAPAPAGEVEPLVTTGAGPDVP